MLRSVEELSKKKGASMAQIAIAWSMAKDGEPPFSPRLLLVAVDADARATTQG